MDDPDFEMADDRRQLHHRPSQQCRRSGRTSAPIARTKAAEQQVAPGGVLPRSAGKAGGYWRHGGRLLFGVAGDRRESRHTCLLADKAYDTNEIIVRGSGIRPELGDTSPKATGGKCGTTTRHCTSCGTWWRTAFLDFISVAPSALTRHSKRAASYHAICQLRAVMIWTNPTAILTTPPSTTVALELGSIGP